MLKLKQANVERKRLGSFPTSSVIAVIDLWRCARTHSIHDLVLLLNLALPCRGGAVRDVILIIMIYRM